MTTFTEEYLQQLIQKHSEDAQYGRSGAGYADKAYALIEDLLAPEASEVVTKSTVKFNLWGFR